LNHKFYIGIVHLLAIFLPSIVILYFAIHTGVLPDYDYWGVLGHILTDNGFSLDINSLSHRANEHLVIIPKMLYGLNIILTGGSNTALALIAWGASLVQVILLIPVIPADIRKKPARGTVFLLIISIFIFTPKAAHNWIWGMSGTMWITANMFVVASISMMYRFNITKQQGWLWTSMLAGLMASICYSTSLVLWPAVLLGACLFRIRSRHLMFIVAVTIAVYLFYILGYVRIPGHPDPELSLYKTILFVLNFLGGLFVSGPQYAYFGKIVALFGIILSGAVVWLRARERGAWREESAPWLMLQVYAIGNGALAGISRAGFGIDAALASRYASLPAFFWLGLCVMWLLYFWRTERLGPYLSLPAVVIALFIFQMYTGSFDYVKRMLNREERKAVASVSLITGIYDERMLKEAVTPLPAQLLALVDRLKRINHVPFNKWSEGWPHLDTKLDLAQLPVADGKQYFGWFDTITPFSPEAARVQGWSFVPNGKVRCVAIVNHDGIVRGLATPGLNRPDVATALKIKDIKTGWGGYTRLVDGDRELRACVLLYRCDQWYRLKQSLPVPGQPMNQIKNQKSPRSNKK